MGIEPNGSLNYHVQEVPRDTSLGEMIPTIDKLPSTDEVQVAVNNTT